MREEWPQIKSKGCKKSQIVLAAAEAGGSVGLRPESMLFLTCCFVNPPL